MKAMLKSELARAAGVSVTTLVRWCRPYEQELRQMGWQKNDKMLNPAIVAFLAEKLCIDTE